MIILKLENLIKDAILKLYNVSFNNVQLQKTRKEFEGDITLVIYPILSVSNKKLDITAKEIAEYLKLNLDKIESYNIVQGFLNIVISNEYWVNQFININNINDFGVVKTKKESPLYLVEFSSPNTNKPLHLGHIRNNLLGDSISRIIKASGKNVKKVQIINDRGIHICKSMIAWQESGKNETPKSSGMKGDHLVGKYYVEFEKIKQKEIEELVGSGLSQKQAEENSKINIKAKDMLRSWESKEKDTIDLWKKMNSWVYDGFSKTYKKLGIVFDKNYYESETYLLGKNIIEDGLSKGIFYKKSDGSVWIDLSAEGLDEKLILRSDGTSVYITQDIGTAVLRYGDFKFSNMIYTVGNEQNYHFKVLFHILKKLGYKWSKNCFHLSYGMVDLPSGKMKSREGTVVDADDLIEEMISTAKNISNDLGKKEYLSESESKKLYNLIGLGALKYFILKVDPKKKILFDPLDSIDFNGNTGPFIQYTYARIQSLKRKKLINISEIDPTIIISKKEKEIIKLLLDFPDVIQEASQKYAPSLIANYIYDLAKEFNNFYQNTPILNDQNKILVNFRLCLSIKLGEVIKTSMNLLGISMPDRM